MQRRNKGQTLVEFALLLPLLLLIVLGIIEFGRVMLIATSIGGGTRDGARYGAVHPGNESGITAEVNARVMLLSSDNITVTVTYDDGPGSTEDSSYTYDEDYAQRVIIRTEGKINTLTGFFEPLIGEDGIYVYPESIRTIHTSE